MQTLNVISANGQGFKSAASTQIQSAVASLMAERFSLDELALDFVDALSMGTIHTLEGRKELFAELKAIRREGKLRHGSDAFRREVAYRLDRDPIASAKWNVMSFRYPHLEICK